MIQSELTDYSGEFIPDFQHELLTREKLAGLVRLYAKFRVVLDGSWYLVAKEVAGDETAFSCDQKVWSTMTEYALKQVTGSMNIKRDGLDSLMKYFQIMGGPYIMEPELISGNLGRLTVVGCHTLDGLEAEGEGRESNICGILELELYQRVATFFNTSIKVKPLVLPPRKVTTDIPCQWELELDGGDNTSSSERRNRKQALEGKITGLEDYSGPFIPGVRLEDFCKDSLCRMLLAYSTVMHRVDGVWYLTVKEAMGNETALACDKKVWERLNIYESKLIADHLNFHEPNVSSVLKYFQTQFIHWNLKNAFELKEPNHGLITTSYCHSLAALEAEGNGRAPEICNNMCTMGYNLVSGYFNPAIKVVPLVIPPQEGPDGISCQWEFMLGD
ncbi:DUF6125 family protein [Chloroflexota bacterium]